MAFQPRKFQFSASELRFAAAAAQTIENAVLTKVAQGSLASEEPPLDLQLTIGSESWPKRILDGAGHFPNTIAGQTQPLM